MPDFVTLGKSRRDYIAGRLVDINSFANEFGDEALSMLAEDFTNRVNKLIAMIDNPEEFVAKKK